MSKLSVNDINKIYLSAAINEDTDFIPLISDEDEEIITKTNIPEALPILPLRNAVLFPGVVIPISVGRNKSMKLIKEIYKNIKGRNFSFICYSNIYQVN